MITYLLTAIPRGDPASAKFTKQLCTRVFANNFLRQCVLKVTKYKGGSYFWKGSSRGGRLGIAKQFGLQRRLCQAPVYEFSAWHKHRYNLLHATKVDLSFRMSTELPLVDSEDLKSRVRELRR